MPQKRPSDQSVRIQAEANSEPQQWLVLEQAV